MYPFRVLALVWLSNAIIWACARIMGCDAMQSQNVSDLIKKSRLLLESCKRDLNRLDEQIAQCIASREVMPHLTFGVESKIEPSRLRLLRENAADTRALSEEANDPEVKRLLSELADSYDLMAN